ncbi:hypothetical protein CMI47_00495 [Candidatus Pacearchaeota archaeon]|nr:hypothetical protein [Candidatus Pacearchaeota archaeon]|tara:strand:+ start:5954 stop:6238 length:285 start_codon:yes stop_codon:yes gene_type:complete
MKPPPDIGDSFLMEILLTPALQEEYGRKVLIVEAVYEGLLSDTEIEVKKEEGSLKEIYNCLDYDEHHIVSFGDTIWINDLIVHDADSAEITPLI